MRQFAPEWDEGAIVQGRLDKVSWYHHVALLDKLSSGDLRCWYAEMAVEHGWSRATLVAQIEGRLHERHLEVGGQDFYLDLLLYQLQLRCYVVIELKPGEFRPEYVGRLGFYLAAVDDLVRQEQDSPSIGLILRAITSARLGVVRPSALAASATCLSTTRLGKAGQLAEANPTSSRSTRARSSPDNTVRSRPLRHTLPSLGSSTPAAIRSNVDLPERRGPHTPTKSPTSSSSDTPSSTTCFRDPSE